MKILFAVTFFIVALLDFSVLELGKNTIIGWILSVCAFLVFLYIFKVPLSDRNNWIKLLSWVCLFAVLVVIGKISAPPVRSIPAVSAKDPVSTGVVTVKQGDLTGVYNQDETVEVYAGIPYAKPPVGELRWKEPQEPEIPSRRQQKNRQLQRKQQKQQPLLLQMQYPEIRHNSRAQSARA